MIPTIDTLRSLALHLAKPDDMVSVTQVGTRIDLLIYRTHAGGGRVHALYQLSDGDADEMIKRAVVECLMLLADRTERARIQWRTRS